MLLKVKGEMYDGKKHSLDRNLTYFSVELTFIFPPISNISFFKNHKNVYLQKCRCIFLLIPQNGTCKVTSSLDI